MCLEMCIFEIQINPHRTLIDCLACKFERIQGFSSDFRYLEEFSGQSASRRKKRKKEEQLQFKRCEISPPKIR